MRGMYLVNSVFDKIIRIFDSGSDAAEPEVSSFLCSDDGEDESEELISEDINEKLEITGSNIELLSKQVMKNSYVKSIENNIRDIEEDLEFLDDAGLIAIRVEELKKRFIVGKEKQNLLRSKTMSAGK